MNDIDYKKLIKELRLKSRVEKDKALLQARNSDSLLEKCVLLRVYTSPQANDAEKLIMEDLEISACLDNISGDGTKNDLKYEIKVSVHDERCKINIRQIRPHHSVDFYIIVALNLFAGENGEAYIFKIPSSIIKELVLEYGAYTHGTVIKNGKICKESIDDANSLYEYSLTANPNGGENTKSLKLWNRFLEYQVEYDKGLF